MGLLGAGTKMPLRASFTATVDDTISITVLPGAPLSVPAGFGAPDTLADQVSIRIGGAGGTVRFADQILSPCLHRMVVDRAGPATWGGSGNEVLIGPESMRRIRA